MTTELTKTLEKLHIVAGAIQSQCDGARRIDGIGFNKFDAEFFRNFVYTYEPSFSQMVSAHSSLKKYKRQIESLGYSELFESIKFDDELLKQEFIENSKLALLSLIENATEKQIPSKGKTVKAIEIGSKKWIWDLYKNESVGKSWFKENGLSIYKNDYLGGIWQVTKWGDIITSPNDDNTPSNLKSYIQFGIELNDNPILPSQITLNHSDKLLAYQVDHVKYLLASLKNFNAVLDASDTGCHKKGTEILMFDGTKKKVEDIMVGDKVMDWKGNAQVVTQLKRGREQMFEIKPVKGDSFIVNKNHILTLVKTNKTSKDRDKESIVIDIKVSDYINKSNRFKHVYKLFRVGVPFTKKDLKLNPYFLGILLGDGYLGSEENSSMSISKNDEEIKTYCEEIIKVFNGRLVTDIKETENSTSVTHFFRECPELKQIIKSLNLFGKRSKDKFVPFEYKTSSVEDRREILAGLLDTDGSYTNNGYDFISKSQTLAEDVVYIARSLGLSAYINKSIKSSQTIKSGEYWRVFINGEVSQLPIKIERKKPLVRKQIKDVRRTGFSVLPLEEDDYYGFSLDGDGRFLLGDFTVTHNTGKTFSALACAKELGLIPIILTPKAVVPSWVRACSKHFGIDEYYVTNYESIKTGKTVYVTRQNDDSYTWNLDPEKHILIFDEVHRCKNKDTLNSRMLVGAKKVKVKTVCLSATIADNPSHLYAVGITLGLFSHKYFNNWLRNLGGYYDDNEMRYVFTEDSLLNVNSQIFPRRGHRISVKELGNLFPETKILPDVFTVSDASQKRINALYDSISMALSQLREKEKTDQGHHLTEILRARQEIELIKIPVFVDLAQDALEENNSVVIIVNFTETLNVLAEKLHTKCVVHGQQTAEEREKNIADFQADKERIIILNIRSGGVGVSLHDLNGNHPRVSLISPSWSAQDVVQAVGRVWRAGSKSSSIQKIVYCANTIEESICEKMKEKIDNINKINEASVSDVFASLLPEEEE